MGWDAGLIQANGRPATWWRPEIDGFVVVFFFFKGKSDTGRNWPECSETNWNLTRGGTDGINVPDCMPV